MSLWWKLDYNWRIESALLKTSKEPLWSRTNECLHIFREYCTLECFVEYSPPSSNLVIEIVCSKDLAQKSYFNGFFHYFNGQLRNRLPRYGHIRHQRLQIYKNWRFVLEFAQIFVLTGFPFFSAAILVRKYQPKSLICNPIQSI